MFQQSMFLAFLLSVGVFAQNEPDPKSNLRPENITDLTYYFYRWTGAYYNGTTTIRIEPQDFIDDSECDTLFNKAVEIVYENSMLAITKENEYIENANPLAFSLRYWDKTANITPPWYSPDGPVDGVTDVSSVKFLTEDRPIGSIEPYWNLTSSHISGSSYSFEGYRNYSINPQVLYFNYSQCRTLSLAEYQGIVLEYDPDDENGSLSDLRVLGPPVVQARFDNQSASITITGVFQGSARSDDPEEMNYLGGPVTISFLGRIDEERSDGLLPNRNNGTPVWNQTLGYDKGVDGKPLQKGAGSRAESGYGIQRRTLQSYGPGFFSLSPTFKSNTTFHTARTDSVRTREELPASNRPLLDVGIPAVSGFAQNLLAGLSAIWKGVGIRPQPEGRSSYEFREQVIMSSNSNDDSGYGTQLEWAPAKPVSIDHITSRRDFDTLFSILFDIMVDQIPLGTSQLARSNEKQSYVLCHPDLDLQNILTDEDGNVTGIIDWEKALAVPRCVGYASLPLFLRYDDHAEGGAGVWPFMQKSLHHYREVYAGAMEATGCLDSLFTRKS
ncbi:hypothetical protein M011DRAFT_483258 [Sporormia fimetaria CBS 119925]|uniref:Aminoglycoside phosphotransferase domain-containing protein n=1 Tax=Sporormia fimetaria CBS 119925 TaxID=1340428 RepID=A0A6A6VME6_9PLEO|nr:hypothetical protein M011DRAFT_483258 [Sporormia fimetaria CBS 119925]